MQNEATPAPNSCSIAYNEAHAYDNELREQVEAIGTAALGLVLLVLLLLRK